MNPHSVSGKIVDVVQGEIFPGTVRIEGGRIASVDRDDAVACEQFVLPGLVNAHVHVESSKMSPQAFGNAVIRNGVLATVSDPHEIANVCGVEGLEWMLANAKLSPIVTIFGVPPCVPATNSTLETNGAQFDLRLVENLLAEGRYPYLAEVMNYPGVIDGHDALLGMVRKAVELGLPVDGHAPGVLGSDLEKYQAVGITSDHECFTLEEAREKATLGMKILIREGSAAKNFEALIPILAEFPNQVMFCTDDSEPHELSTGQIDSHVRRALAAGFEPMSVFRAATLNPVRHYSLPLGLLQPGDPADFIMASNDFVVLGAVRKGNLCSENGRCDLPYSEPTPINRFAATLITEESLRIPAPPGKSRVRVIRAIPGQLVTEVEESLLESVKGVLKSDPGRGVLKIVVLNRYDPNAKPQVAFVSGLGIKRGAIASTVAHDSHNIVAVGADDAEIAWAINLVISSRGGQSLVLDGKSWIEPLDVAGLMSTRSPDQVIDRFCRLEQAAKGMGPHIGSPYMAASFLSLLVIPRLKLSDRVGLFDVIEFKPVSLFV